MMSNAQYIRDLDVNAALDGEIRDLLCCCFGAGFKKRRYAQEQPAHRWLMRSDEGTLVGHVAAHDKAVTTSLGARLRILGISEAATHPDHRNRGYLRRLLASSHEWGAVHGFGYSVLFGYPRFYTSSGYHEISNLFDEQGNDLYTDVMATALGPQPWPLEICCLGGQRF